MLAEEGGYSTLTPAPVILNKGLNAKDGADTSSSTFLNRSFWSGTLGFSGADWNFNRVAIEGYPRLAWE